MEYVVSYNTYDRGRRVMMKSIDHTFITMHESQRDRYCDRYKKWIGKVGVIIATTTRYPNSYLVDFGRNRTFWVGKEDIEFL